MISQNYSYPIMNTGAVNLSEVKERFLENVLREVSSHLTDDQYNFIRTVIVSELSKVEILDPLRGYDERLEEECSKLLDLFIKAKELEGLSPKSIKYYEGSLKRLFKFLDNKPISQITADDIRGFLSSVLDTGSSTRSANNLRRIYSSFFNWCFVEDHILKSPMLKVRPLKERKEVKKELNLTPYMVEKYRKQGVKDNLIIGNRWQLFYNQRVAKYYNQVVSMLKQEKSIRIISRELDLPYSSVQRMRKKAISEGDI